MSLSREQVKSLALEVHAALPPAPVELVLLPSGQTFTQDALNLARLYDNATFQQRNLLAAVAEFLRA